MVDDGDNGKLQTEHQELQQFSEVPAKVKHAGGRPSVEEDVNLQKKYIEIYVNHVVGGMSEQEVSIQMGISRTTVREALAWCRTINTVYATAEQLADGINTINFKMNWWANKQNKLKKELDKLEEEKQAWEGATEAERLTKGLKPPKEAKIDNLVKTIVIFENMILGFLDRKFNLQNLYQKQLSAIGVENMQITMIKTITAEIKASGVSEKDRYAIAEILERSAHEGR